MKRSQRIEITSESHRVIRVRVPQGAVRGWCRVCRSEAVWVTPSCSAVISGVTERKILKRVENGSLHSSETPAGALLVRLNSLLNSLKETNKS